MCGMIASLHQLMRYCRRL